MAETDNKQLVGNDNSNSIILTGNVEPLSKPKYVLGNMLDTLKRALLWVVDLLWSMVLSIVSFGKMIAKGAIALTLGVYRFFKKKVHQFVNNDLPGRLSFVLFGASSFANKQYVNGILFNVFEIGYIIFMSCFGFHSIGMLATLGTNTGGEVCDDMFCEQTMPDNSIMLLIYGLLCLLSIAIFIYIWNRSITSGYNNYRINHFMRFKDIYEKNEEISTNIDNDVKELIENDSDLNDYKKNKLHSYSVDFSYIEDEKLRKQYQGIEKEVVLESYNSASYDYTQIKNQKKKLEQMKAKLDKYKENRESLFTRYPNLSQSGQLIIKRNTESRISKRVAKINAQEHKIYEMSKTHMPYASKMSVENANNFEKFNVYYKTTQDYVNHITFYKHYEEIANKYDSLKDEYQNVNIENAKRKEQLLVECDEKVKEINAKYDEIVSKKKTLVTELKKLTDSKALEIKQAGKNPTKINEIEDKYFTKISTLAADLHKLPEDKAIEAMRKDEIKEVKHACDRDRKYLKTNFTSETYSKEETINTLLIDYKFEYAFAKEVAAEVMIKDGDSLRHLTKEEVNLKLNELQNALDDFEKKHQDKYVGKPKSFKEQVQGLLNGNFHLTILALPVLGIVLFTIVPLVFSILIAFTNYSFGHQPPTQLFTWNGFENFVTLFAAPADSIYSMLPSALMQTLGWTICWTIIATFSNYFLGILLALLINKKSIKLKKLWRTIFIMTIAVPQFISLMSIGTLLKDTGAVGTWWMQTFGHRLGFGTDSTNGAIVSKIIILIVNVWVGIPYTLLSTTGILMNIPTDLYESATVDGAGPWKQFTKITLPYILFVTGSYLITQFIGNINNFNIIFFLTGGGPNIPGSTLGVGNTDLLITFIYKMVTSDNNPQYGIASAIGIVIFVICAFFSIIMYNKSSSVKGEDQFQ